MAAIGKIERFDKPDKLAAYIGLNPSVHQSGDGPAYHGRITKRGRSNARHLLVEAAWQTARAPGPLRAFFERVRAKRGNHIAAVAVARKPTVIIWHLLTKGEDYAWVRPALHAKKIRDLELRAGIRNAAVNEADPMTTISLIGGAKNGFAASWPKRPTSA